MLEVRGIQSGYGRVPILRDISLSAPSGQLTLVLGPNGAGKTTLLQSIAGFNRPTAGEVALDGKSITRLKPDQMVSEGLRLVLDGHRVFPRLTVAENIRLGAGRQPKDFDARRRDVFEVFPILEQKLDQPASSLSGGQQQMLALAQAFMARPKALLVDEPSLGLAEMLIPTILSFLKKWSQMGTAVVLVEQRIDIALTYCDSVYVLKNGHVAFEARSRDKIDNEKIHAIYFGN